VDNEAVTKRRIEQTQVASAGTPYEALVPVLREWNGWELSQVRACDLEDIHWFQPQGAPRHLLHAFIPRSKIVSGALASSFDDDASRLMICVLKSHTPPAIYGALATRADGRH
jgi:hypothetical protein